MNRKNRKLKKKGLILQAVCPGDSRGGWHTPCPQGIRASLTLSSYFQCGLFIYSNTLLPLGAPREAADSLLHRWVSHTRSCSVFTAVAQAQRTAALLCIFFFFFPLKPVKINQFTKKLRHTKLPRSVKNLDEKHFLPSFSSGERLQPKSGFKTLPNYFPTSRWHISAAISWNQPRLSLSRWEEKLDFQSATRKVPSSPHPHHPVKVSRFEEKTHIERDVSSIENRWAQMWQGLTPKHPVQISVGEKNWICSLPANANSLARPLRYTGVD